MWTKWPLKLELPCYNLVMNPSNNPADANNTIEPRHDTPNHDMTREDASSDTPLSKIVTSTFPPSNASFDAADRPEPESAFSRPDTTERDTTRHGASRHDLPGLNAPMRDTTRHDASCIEAAQDDDAVDTAETEPPENWLDIRQAEILLRKLGISRTTRSVQRFCQKGDLEARLVPTENGSRYIINERSIHDLAERFHEILPGNGFGADEQKPVRDVSHSGERSDPSVALDTKIPDGHIGQIIELKDQQIVLLTSQLDTANRQITVKDEQISTMHERDHETNILIQNLQRLIALPEGRSRSSGAASPIPGPIDVDH